MKTPCSPCPRNQPSAENLGSYAFGGPDDHLLMQRQGGNVAPHDISGLVDHLRALWGIDFNADARDQVIEHGIGIATEVDFAPLAIAGA